MRLTLDAIAVLDAIERKGSFAAAAKELHRVPSAITYAVQKLESDLGVRLFERSGHRAVLTPAGEALLEEGRRLLQAASALEGRVRRVATGWEGELRVAVGDLVPMARIYSLASDFYALESGTRLRLSREVFGGCWDALVSDRADLVIGAPSDVPSGGGFAVRELGAVEFQFAVAPFHPLAMAPEPLANEDILRHRAIAAADSSRSLPPRTANILSGQDVLTVPDFRDKLEAHLLGMGVGWLPRHLIQSFVAAGRLVVRETEERQAPVALVAAWRTGKKGRALEWFRQRLEDEAWRERLFSPF